MPALRQVLPGNSQFGAMQLALEETDIEPKDPRTMWEVRVFCTTNRIPTQIRDMFDFSSPVLALPRDKNGSQIPFPTPITNISVGATPFGSMLAEKCRALCWVPGT